ncbi:MAG: AAA family ATPase, partial [Mediterranea sp.]|nr:AAA family ATPase [Mediterranea sp.]
MDAVKEIPYGMSNFEDVISQNRYYVDKTMYIPELEKQANYLIFIRPRRFGKSLLLSMLRSYYDIAQKEKFEELFGDLWIGERPTSRQGTYQVLHFDFSQIGGHIDDLSERFDSYCAVQLGDFMN